VKGACARVAVVRQRAARVARSFMGFRVS